VEEAEGGGGAPSPAADEELKRLGKKREDAPHVSLAIWMGNHRLGYQATLIARFPSTYPQIFQIAAGDHGRSSSAFLPPYPASARGSARLWLNRFALFAQRLMFRLGLKRSSLSRLSAIKRTLF
jgi:hypothetical protein